MPFLLGRVPICEMGRLGSLSAQILQAPVFFLVEHEVCLSLTSVGRERGGLTPFLLLFWNTLLGLHGRSLSCGFLPTLKEILSWG